jgi:transitional endoplasmic reticulum ATPase
MTSSTFSRHPDATLYRRHAAHVTSRAVLHALDKQAVIDAVPRWHRKSRRLECEAEWAAEEKLAHDEAAEIIRVLRGPITDLETALGELAAVGAAELLGKVEAEQLRLRAALTHLDSADEAASRGDFGAAGAAVEDCEREVSMLGGRLIVAMNKALGQAAIGKEMRSRLEENVAERRQAKIQLDRAHGGTDRPMDRVGRLEAAGRLRRLEAAGYRVAAQILANQVRSPAEKLTTAKVGRDTSMRVLPPSACETFADIGGLAHVKDQLRETIGAILERPDEAIRLQVVHNGVLFYGPPGTGKNLLSRALAGEYGLRYLRFSPAAIASVYLHEAATNLRKMFELARANTPCVLYLDEIDTIASDRGDQPSADHREVVTQLMICLEEYRTVPGLVIAAGTNDLERLDPALREGRFDAKVQVPLPGPEDRAEVLAVHLNKRGDAVEPAGLDLGELARLTNGYNAAALETVVSLAAQEALKTRRSIDQAMLVKAITDRGGQHRISLEARLDWDDVVLAADTRERVMEILTVFAQPELARQLGVAAPAGIVLHGPPGTGKTTIAKAMASQIAASFYEMSAAELLSKWAGESEQRVAKLFTQARANRPSIIFIDEIDALLRRRQAESTSKWEERVLSQFLRELDGLRGGAGVLLVGATNRLDTLDEAIVGRRLEPIGVGLPDENGRHKLLVLLCRGIKLARGVDLKELAGATEGMSGADLKRLRDTAGMKALTRTSRAGGPPKGGVSVTRADFFTALDAQRSHASMAEV